MKPLRKSETQRLGHLCEKIRRALHIEHWEHRYECRTKQPEGEGRLVAQHQSYVEGRRLYVILYPVFWDQSYDEQVQTLIHEHLHAVQQSQDQIIAHIIDRSHIADRGWANEMYNKQNEILTDHLTAVIYELMSVE